LDTLLEHFRNRQSAVVERIAELARIESPSSDPAAVNRAVDLVAEWAAPLGEVRRETAPGYGDHLTIDVRFPGAEGRILCMGHLDTVYLEGTLATMPVEVRDGRLWGPGVFDMKGGVVYFLEAIEALRALEIPVKRNLRLRFDSDEEIGSPSSSAAVKADAKASVAVLVAEPSYGLDGRVKTARKGGGKFKVRVEGRESHAGLDFASGASAVLELARQIDRIAEWTDLEAGVTVNPGTIRGGTTPNVVAGEAQAVFDVRVPRADQAAEIERRFGSLTPFDERCRVTVEGGLGRPPMERGPATVPLYEKAKRLAAEMGVELNDAAVGGGSDGNFTAALGIPTLDGLGAVGEGAHSSNESILLDRIPDRIALIAKLIATI